MSVEEHKLDELFTLTYSFDPLKTLMRSLLDKMAQQTTQLLYVRELGDRFSRQLSMEKVIEGRLTGLEALTTQQTKGISEIRQDSKKLEGVVKGWVEKVGQREEVLVGRVREMVDGVEMKIKEGDVRANSLEEQLKELWS